MSTTVASETLPAAVDLHGLVKEFRTDDGPLRAVDGVDLTISPGEIVAFLGPNGAGKTTTLDMVLGLTEPSAGTVSIHGTRPRRAVAGGRISAMLQSGGLLRDLTVRETVRMIASTFPVATNVDDVIERTGLGEIAGRKISKCSGGEQQRLRFALSLLPDPDLLILDEPTAGMDVGARRDFWDTMRADAANGRTVIFATHYLEEADTFAQRIVLIAGGTVIADGSTSEIRAHAEGRTISARIDMDVAGSVTSRLESLGGVHEVRIDGERVTVRGSDSDHVARVLLTELGGSALEITSGSLDDAFTTLTEGAAR